ncbi:glycoside hydrolase family 16 protein [Pseudomassariella vexata]|uniref:Glycoside hydrolase family 16 protein n=1 Tax=Pseudomassariella vexata TaxID=1141098 RepID=A0A1Y2EE88_9PEZI|nr:glycoside hydrolase family 16 protein [Pseudomassariella vexata]ORY69576.1 glycoside hydrolase family 16 protein [Pseudomassariella vexata]
MALPRIFQCLLVVFCTSVSSVVAEYQQIDDSKCDCYLTNGTDGNYFATHKFFDFRSLSQYANVPGIIDDQSQSTDAEATSDYFLSREWTESWGTQQWNNSGNFNNGDAAVFMVNSLNNVYIEKNADSNAGSETFLTLRTARLDNFQSAAEFESIPTGYHFLSLRMYARTIGAPGAITAMFTYRSSDDPMAVQESDLEVRTEDPPEFIQYTNQPSYSRSGNILEAATRNASVPVGWDNWAVHRLDWSPTSTSWYVDGQNVSQISFQTPRDPSQVIFNAWSDGSEWVGNMTEGDAAYFQIQWIEMVYNMTGTDKTTDAYQRVRSRLSNGIASRDDASCTNICSIDATQEIGTAVLIQGTNPSPAGSSSFTTEATSWKGILIGISCSDMIERAKFGL